MKTRLYDKSQSSGFRGRQGPQEFGVRDGGREAVTYLATDLIIQTSTIPGRVIYTNGIRFPVFTLNARLAPSFSRHRMFNVTLNFFFFENVFQFLSKTKIVGFFTSNV